MDRARLERRLRTMDERVWSLGLSRHDPADLTSHPLLMALGSGRGRYLGYPLRALAMVRPLWVRRALGIAPALVPSALYHLGTTYAFAQAGGVSLPPARLDEVCRAALSCRASGEHACWEHPYPSHGAVYRVPDAAPGVPRSCAHHTARIGIMLLRAGHLRARSEWIDVGVSAARALVEYHRVTRYPDGTATISYYPDTADEVINTAADAALLLLAAARVEGEEAWRDLGASILRLVIAEQRPDGSWRYTTARSHERFGVTNRADNHHTAMVLLVLADVLAHRLCPDLSDALERALTRGLRFYLDRFFRPDGTARSFPDGRRPGAVACYGEGPRALLAASLVVPDDALARRARAFAPVVLERAFRRLYRDDGDVASEERFLIRTHLRSVRWGSGLLMEATAAALAHPCEPAFPPRRTEAPA